MLDQNERTWRNRFPPSSGTGGRVVERYEEVGGSDSADGSTVAPDGETDLRSCPVCEFASAEYNDVYGHLMTAHRKSTISELLLETR
jgi:hypothetical protein